MQQESPQFYSGLTSHLSPDEQSVIQGAFNQAEVNAQAAQNAQISQSAIPNGGVS